MKAGPMDMSAPSPAPSSGFEMAMLAFAVVLLAFLLFLSTEGRSFRDFRMGLALGLRGLLGKELRSRSRGWRPMLALTGYLGILTVAVAGFLALMSQVGGTISPSIGLNLFSALAVVSVLLLAFITPALTVGSISGERERRTLELLMVTRASGLGLAAGKLLGSLFYILFLLVASLPAFALVYLFGGIPPLSIAMVLLVGAVTAVAHSALGLVLSALLRRTLVASVAAYILVLGVVFGMPFVSTVMGIAAQARSNGQITGGGTPVYMYASPVVSIFSVLPGGTPGGGMGTDLIGGLLLGRRDLPVVQRSSVPITRSVYVSSMNPATGQVEVAETWAPWVYHSILGGLFTLFALLVSALSLAPVKPWRMWRARRRLAMSSE